MLGIYEFKLLPYVEQLTYIWYHGTFLATRISRTHKVNLYHIDTFFIEVFFDPIKNELLGLRSFVSKTGLELYTDFIKIEFE